MNSTQSHDFYPATTGHTPLDTFDDQDTLTLQCVFAGRSEKAMWLTCPDGKTRLFAVTQTHIMTGEQQRTEHAVIAKGFLSDVMGGLS
ncbi:hypothetical protein [Thiothrix lacustris]|uniref:hypothetical protein n=1 Tax=Thiothrix lacustris TaxID=525917 RepID=UPI00048B61AA|nr:hypothetical protein [Thiothrix lacustris]